jgi:hypothetical protein
MFNFKSGQNQIKKKKKHMEDQQTNERENYNFLVEIAEQSERYEGF